MGILRNKDPRASIVEAQNGIAEALDATITEMEAFLEEFNQNIKKGEPGREDLYNAIESLEGVVIEFQERLEQIEIQSGKVEKVMQKMEPSELGDLYQATEENMQEVEEIVNTLGEDSEKLDGVFRDAERKLEEGDLEAAESEVVDAAAIVEKHLDKIKQVLESSWNTVG